MKRLVLFALLLLGFAWGQQYLVTATYYWAVPSQTDDTPHIASCGPLSGVRLREGWHIVALSRDLFFREDGSKRCGELVFVKLETGDSIWGIVWDTMAPRFTLRVDVLVATGYRPAWGKAYGVLEFIDGY